VFEYIDGINLRDLVEAHGPLPYGEAIRYTLQIADALAHAWQRNVVHRDIKPSNILVTADGQAKLVDMGLARLHVEEVDEELTATGMTLGTFDYISPEQARDPRAADTRSDIYSLGCTLFFILAGRPPFPGGTLLQKLLSHQADTPPELRDFRPDVPDSIVELIGRMLAKKVEDRVQSPSDLVIALTAVAAELGLSEIQPRLLPLRPRRTPVGRRLTRHVPWLVPVTLLLLSVLGMQLFLWGGRKPAEPPFPKPERIVPRASPEKTNAPAERALLGGRFAAPADTSSALASWM
jgi:serine/threonine-protein kinase